MRKTQKIESHPTIDKQANWGISTIKEVHAAVVQAIDGNVEISSEQEAQILHDMFARAFEHTLCAAHCLKRGNAASSEALSRVSLEASITLSYVSLNDLIPTITAYFLDYLTSEEEQNRKWRNSIDSSPFDSRVKSAHYTELSKKKRAIETYEKILNKWLLSIKAEPLEKSKNFPNIFDRFEKIGKELSYRTVYAALCSQSHADAEDIINFLMARLIPQNLKEMGKYQNNIERENIWFSTFMVIIAVHEFVEASGMYLGKFNICPLSQFKKLIKNIQETEAKWVNSQEMFIAQGKIA
jgi:hypothetical protein